MAVEAGAAPRLRHRAASSAAVVVLALRRDDVAALIDGARPGPLLAALVLSLASLAQSAWFWSRGLADLRSGLPFAKVLEATVAAIPGRYLPGSVWYAAGRVGALRGAGASTAALAVVAVLETLLSFVVAVALGAGLLVAGGSDDAGLGVLSLGAAAVVLCLTSSPWVVNPVVRWVGARRGIHDVPAVGWSGYAELVGHLVLFWVASAAAFWCYLAAFPAVDAPGLLRTAGTFLVSWAAGFVAVFAPQGAGVFETAMAGLLDGPVAALALVIAGYRALVAVRDALPALVRARRGAGQPVEGRPTADAVVARRSERGRQVRGPLAQRGRSTTGLRPPCRHTRPWSPSRPPQSAPAGAPLLPSSQAALLAPLTPVLTSSAAADDPAPDTYDSVIDITFPASAPPKTTMASSYDAPRSGKACARPPTSWARS